MVWKSFAEFIDMGGYALYVWGSYAVTALVLGAELVLLRQRRRGAREDVARWRVLHDDGDRA
jgi:heme exporter protein D